MSPRSLGTPGDMDDTPAHSTDLHHSPTAKTTHFTEKSKAINRIQRHICVVLVASLILC